MIPQRNIIETSRTLREAIDKLNKLSGSEMTLMVVDNSDNMLLVGTITDGDVRRALLEGVSLDKPVSEAMFRGFRKLWADTVDKVDTMRHLRKAGITMVPVVDTDGRLVDVFDLARKPTCLPMRAVLMAGGRGERLGQLTKDTPKPLLEVDGKAIIDYNVEALARVGIDDMTVCTRYLAEKIYDHFSQPVGGVKVKCVTEDKPLGTIGAVTLMPGQKDGITLVMNSDLLTTVSFEDMYIHHRDAGADVTVGVVPYQVSVPFAILTVEGNDVTGIEEKPSYSHYANGGIYIFNNKILDMLEPGEPADAPDLIRRAIDAGCKVTYFVITGTWIDVGSPTDFSHAAELMRHLRNLRESVPEF